MMMSEPLSTIVSIVLNIIGPVDDTKKIKLKMYLFVFVLTRK